MSSPNERAGIIKKAIHEYAYHFDQQPTHSTSSPVNRNHHHPRSISSNNKNDLSDVIGVTPQIGLTKFDSVYSTTTLRHSTGRGAFTPFLPGQYEETLLSEKRSTRSLYEHGAPPSPHSPSKTLLELTFESKKRSWRARKEANHQLGVLRNETLIAQARDEMAKFPLLVHKSEKQMEDFLANADQADESQKKKMMIMGQQSKSKVHSRLRNAKNRSPPPLQSMFGKQKENNNNNNNNNKLSSSLKRNSSYSDDDTNSAKKTTRFQLATPTIDDHQHHHEDHDIFSADVEKPKEENSGDPLEIEADPNLENTNSPSSNQMKTVMTFDNRNTKDIAAQEQQHRSPQQENEESSVSASRQRMKKKFRPPTSKDLIQLSAPPPPTTKPKSETSSLSHQLPPTSPSAKIFINNNHNNESSAIDDDKEKRRQEAIAAAHDEKALRVASHQMDALRSWVQRSAGRAKWLRDGISRINNEGTRLASVLDEPPIVSIVEFERTVERPRREQRLKEQRKQPLNVVEGNGDEVDDVIRQMMDAEAQNRKSRDRMLKEERERRAQEALQRRMALQKAKMDAERAEAEKNGGN